MSDDVLRSLLCATASEPQAESKPQPRTRTTAPKAAATEKQPGI